MPSKLWIKLYHEILDDPKMGRLPDRLFRRCIQLFLLAGEYDQDGLLPELADMAWRFHLTDEELEADLAELARINITACTEHGWLVVHFAKRQSKVDGAERTRQWRDRTKKQAQGQPEPYINEGGDEPVTQRHKNCDEEPVDRDIDIDKDSLPKGNGAEAPPLEPEEQELETQPEGSEPSRTKSELEPANEREALLFEKLKPEFQAKGYRPPGKFPSLACKRKYVARADFLGDYTAVAIERALQKGITSVTRIVDFIAKWDPAKETTNQKGQSNGHNSRNTNITGLQSQGGTARKHFNPGTGETYWTDAAGNRIPDPPAGRG
jgi:hypothetical protein